MFDNAQNILGFNSANNKFVSSAVVANPDGSVIERLESIQQQVGAVDGADNILGANDADNGFSSSSVVANENGSIIEREEFIQSQIGTPTNTGGSANLGAMLGDFAGSSLINRLGTLSNTGGSANLGAIIGDPTGSSLVARLGNIQTETDLIGAIANTGGSANLGAVLGDFTGSSLVDRLGTFVNTGGTAKLGSIIGDFAGSSLISKLTTINNNAKGDGVNKDAENYLEVTVDLSSGTWNTVGTHELLEIAGTVGLRMAIECTNSVTDDSTSALICLGHESATSAFIAATSAPAIDVNEFWHDTAPTTTPTFGSGLIERMIPGGLDVGYEIAGTNLVSGTLKAYVRWEALNSSGNVTAGAGGAL